MLCLFDYLVGERMPEIWLNYGRAEVVLDIKAENLDEKIDSVGDVLDDSTIEEKLGNLELSKPIDLAVLHDSWAIRKIISTLFLMCEKRSIQFPKVFAEKHVMRSLKSGLPEGSEVSEFNEDLSANLVFLSEMELDGLFGYETVATRLLRKFGDDRMLTAYAKRGSNIPEPGKISDSFGEAKKFADGFDIKAIEIIANSRGIVDFEIGHPSSTASLTKSFESVSIKDIGLRRSMIISTGKGASNNSLDRSLRSLWNCQSAIKDDGLAIIVAECTEGLGSESLQQYVEGRLTPEKLANPSRYISGMENLLYLTEIQKRFQVGLVSILPEFYVKKVGVIPLAGIKAAMDYILKTQGTRQKVSVVSDGARLLLR